ncbi:MAG: hypothetical protein V3W26_04500 [Thermodesulfobacteriota bacterium]
MKEQRRGIAITVALMFVFLFLSPLPSIAGGKEKTILFHLKTSLKHDDSQVCVAYNMIWAALDKGLNVDVLIDADAINTFKVGWRGKDSIEDFPLPERLRRSLSKQFEVAFDEVPEKYGQFLGMLHNKGANFYINTAFLVLAKIEGEMGKVENISAKFFKPVILKEMLELIQHADYYMAY